MKKYNSVKITLTLILALSFSTTSLWSQDTNQPAVDEQDTPISDGTPSNLALDQLNIDGKNPNAPLCTYGSCTLATNVIDNFEQAGSWYGKMYVDYGVLQIQRRRGYADNLRETLGKRRSTFVLGMKTTFRKTYFSFAEINPPSDIQLYGKVKRLRVWAFGKSLPHKLYALIVDARGKEYKAPFSSGAYKNLNFEGWQQLEATIPMDYKYTTKSDYYKRRVVQKNPLLNSYYYPEGIRFKKFIVEFDAEYTTGVYYLYLDQFEYISDIHEYSFLKKMSELPIEELKYPLENW